MVGMYRAFFCTKEQSVVTSAYICEKCPLSTHCGNEFTLAVQDENLAIHSENEHEAREL